ncbi:MAG: prolyl oligopeptidase family serine peptidase [Bacteroidaceae bacterium]|nr:prolyl oligopeptidase family serine peptidase [Bacteroidaceae bacterium]
MIFSALLLIVLFVGAVSYYIVYAGLHPSPTDEKQTLNYMYSEYPYLKPWMRKLERNMQLRDTTILSPDSVQLHAYYIPAPHPTPNTAVVIHGHRGCAFQMLHIAYMYQHDLGFNVLLPELRTHGKSGGTHIQMGWNDRKDIQLWIKTLAPLLTSSSMGRDTIQTASPHRGGDTPQGRGGLLRIVIHGISMGAATAMMLAGDETPDCVKCFVEDCGYTSVWDEFAYVAKRNYNVPAFPFMHIANQICRWKYGWNFHEASALKQVKNAVKPMLFIHGTEDHYVPTEMVHQLYRAKPRNKAIWEAPGSRHAYSYHDHKDEYTHQVDAFVKSYFYKKK